MPDPRRIKRLENLILQTLAPLISPGLSDPRLAMITVTRIRLSQDLSVARVNWSCIGKPADRSKALHALDHIAWPGFVRKHGQEVGAEPIPQRLLFAIHADLRFGDMIGSIEQQHETYV